jgi:hypothetical protein
MAIEPFKKISWQSLLVESPIHICFGRNFHRIPATGKALLDYAPCIYQGLTSRSIDLHSVAEVREEQLVKGVQFAQISMCSNDKWLHDCMSPEPGLERKNLIHNLTQKRSKYQYNKG